MIEQIGLHRRETQPARGFPQVDDEQQPDFPRAAAADHPPAHVVIGKRRSHFRFDLVDVLRSERLAHQRLRLGVQSGGVALADAVDLHALDQIARIGVTAPILIAHVRHTTRGPRRRRWRRAPQRRIAAAPLRSGASSLRRARSSGRRRSRDVFQARTETAEVERNLRRGDDGAVEIGRLRDVVHGTASRASTSGFGHVRSGLQALRHHLSC